MHKRRARTRMATAGTVALLATTFAACGSSSGGGGGGGSNPSQGVKAKEVDIGVLADLTGPTAVTQVPFVDGIKTQVAAANAAGGVNGRKIKLLTEDEKYDVATGLAGYKKLATQTPTLGIVGLNNSSLQVAAIKLLPRYKVPVFGAESTTKEALQPFNPYFWAMQCSYADQADVAVPYMTKQVGKAKPRVASIGLDVSSGYEWAGQIKDRVTKEGGTYLGNTALPPTASEADAQVQKIQAKKPDFIALHGSSATSVVVLKSMRKFGLKVPVISIFAAGGIAAYQGLPQASGKLLTSVNCYTPPTIDEAGTADMKAKAQKFGFAKSATSTDYVNGYVVGQVLVAALKAAGKDPTRVSFGKGLDSLSDLSTGGLSPNVTFGPKDHAGIQTVRPYTYDYATKKFKADGTYDQYKSDISNVYLGGS